MPRLVERVAHGPREITQEDVGKWNCMCGLSANQPFCDGSHQKTKTEETDKLYMYEGKTHERKEIEKP